MKKYFIIPILVALIILFSKETFASEKESFVTIVNPVRSSIFWQSKNSLQKQIDLISKLKLPSTWLIQYDLLIDEENLKKFQNLPNDQEIGVFLEISEKLADDSYVPYLIGEGDWARPDKLLLSGYSPIERKRLIDKLFGMFKNKFGYYPSSVCAWYIDTLSLDYMVKKYRIKSVMDVSDQYSTDKYGVWGKPWGMPYIPSYFNSLVPAKGMKDSLDVVKIQWAARDPVRGYGKTAKDSIHSTQANDYINNGFDTDYFKKIASFYLFSDNPIKQLTVGIEVGQEGESFYEEYKRQLEYLKQLYEEKKVNFLTMSSFADTYKQKVSITLPAIFISSTDYLNPLITAYWFSNSFYRIGFIKKDSQFLIRDLKIYPNYFLFDDIYRKDQSPILQKILPTVLDETVDGNSKILFSDIMNIKGDRKNDNVKLLLTEKNGQMHTISLLKDKILIDQKSIFEVTYKNDLDDLSDKFKARTIIDYWLNYPHYWYPDWRFSYVNGRFYVGLMFASDKLIGISSKFSFIGVYQFPFQTLVRFRTLPKLNLTYFVSDYLVKSLNNSTIKITLSYP